jgi:hypothetical protein
VAAGGRPTALKKYSTPLTRPGAMPLDTDFSFMDEVGLDADGRELDPDSCSPRLYATHQQLWSSRDLPSGRRFDLTIRLANRGYELLHESDLGKFRLSSDGIATSLWRWLRKMKPHLWSLLDKDEIAKFQRINDQIGGRIVFPSNKIDDSSLIGIANNARRKKLNNINGARGFHPRICDRFDLTLECIRRHYVGEWSPLRDVLGRYATFFELFETFAGYVDFFMLDDLLENDRTRIRFFLPFDGDFQPYPLPSSIEEYWRFRDETVRFVKRRNELIRYHGKGLELPPVACSRPVKRRTKIKAVLPQAPLLEIIESRE